MQGVPDKKLLKKTVNVIFTGSPIGNFGGISAQQKNQRSTRTKSARRRDSILCLSHNKRSSWMARRTKIKARRDHDHPARQSPRTTKPQLCAPGLSVRGKDCIVHYGREGRSLSHHTVQVNMDLKRRMLRGKTDDRETIEESSMGKLVTHGVGYDSYCAAGKHSWMSKNHRCRACGAFNDEEFIRRAFVDRQREMSLYADRQREMSLYADRQREISLYADRQYNISLYRIAREMSLDADRQRQISLDADRQREMSLDVDRQREMSLDADRQREMSLDADRQREISLDADRQREISLDVKSGEMSSDVKSKHMVDPPILERTLIQGPTK